MLTRRRKIVRWFGVAAVFGAAVAAVAAAALLAPGLFTDTYELLHRAAWRARRELLIENQILSWKFYALLAVLLLLERFRPVRRRKEIFSPAFVQDCLWFVAGACFIGAVLPGLWSLLWRHYDRYLSFLRVESVDLLPIPAQIAIVILLSDFVRWFHHILRHKITLFWCFHSVHHSQQNLNAFTDLRVHPVERIIETVVSALPFFALNPHIGFSAVAAWGMFGIWHARFYHSNIRTNLGWLRYVLVTPQSHRIHHSHSPEHQDRNFGAVFSIWDYLFGTQYWNYDEYPETGIDDASFPYERTMGVRAVASTFVRQLVYPFRLVAASVSGSWRARVTGELWH